MKSRYQLLWPVDLALWEVRRVLSLDDSDFPTAMLHLLSEVCADGTAATDFRAAVNLPTDIWASPSPKLDEGRRWVEQFVRERNRLSPYVAPTYFAERNGHIAAYSEPREHLAMAFATLLSDLQDHGYFPVALPRECVDEPVSWSQVSEEVRHAIHLPFEWDGTREAARDWDDPTLYSLMEYFHDAAQRPRSEGHVHSFAGCGPHYADHNAESGTAVYRWRVNALLERYSVNMRMGKAGDERGRLVAKLGGDLDTRADDRASRGAENPKDEVAQAIRTYRQRGASAVQKRSALALLAGELEHRRERVKVVLGKDEDDLFRIANKFGIRHKRADQQMDYGDEFLDYLFTVFLGAVLLMEQLERGSDGKTAI
ncbi:MULTISPECIES: hypothetical protein [unclassified Microbacterium]|uniref:hypothetical protein n=1 Tax=unclassified Microbacterium TaxID=2609290 RepID=UPI000EA85D09|nr:MULTISPECIES: hypothetical protein [unclassified Microbacterium]MBT2485941.1 hypothetical protein [Microbacterium sp. ISL-108]RKN68687.1 hypothetical protein D7252_14620 [Microbacterium sp. CGR2]